MMNQEDLNLLKLKIKSLFKDVYYKKSYAQNGEDLILNFYIKGIKKGFFVDIGAFHPSKYSNTNLFYKKGWSGINIDANPDTIKLFNSKRKRDINVNIGVNSEKGELDFYCFNKGAVNTFSPEQAQRFSNVKGFEIKSVKKIKTDTLENILEANMPENQKIDFMSIDVEGLDLLVVKSNNWNKYRPKYLLVEDLDTYFASSAMNSQMYHFLKSVGYELVAKNVNTLFFEDQRA